MQCTMKPPNRRAKDGADVEIDMTPMIDVTFLLIIFFLCLEFKTLEGRLGFNLPKKVGQRTTIAAPLDKLDIGIVNVSRGTPRPDPHNPRRFELENHLCRWVVGPRPVRTIAELTAILKREVGHEVADPKTGALGPRLVSIKSGEGVTNSDVTQVIDLVRHVGFEDVVIAAR